MGKVIAVISFIKNKPIKFIFTVLLIIILSLNYLGFCYSQSRFLTDEEKINIVAKHILSYQTIMSGVISSEYIERVKLVDKDKGQRLQLEKDQQGEYVPYKDIDEFFTLNPGCCTVTTHYRIKEGEGDYVSYWSRLTGGLQSSIVGYKYLERYRNREGVTNSKLTEGYQFVSNCGHIWND